jgi:hypothetical protein
MKLLAILLIETLVYLLLYSLLGSFVTLIILSIDIFILAIVQHIIWNYNNNIEE